MQWKKLHLRRGCRLGEISFLNIIDIKARKVFTALDLWPHTYKCNARQFFARLGSAWKTNPKDFVFNRSQKGPKIVLKSMSLCFANMCLNRRLSIVLRFHLYWIPFKPPRFESAPHFPFLLFSTSTQFFPSLLFSVWSARYNISLDLFYSVCL